MVKLTRIGTGLYMLFVLYMVFWSQARCSDGKYTPDPEAPKRLTNITIADKKTLPANWSEAAKPGVVYRKLLNKSTAALLTLPDEVPEGLKRLKRLEAQQSIGPIDPLMLAVTTTALQAHDRANFKVRKTAMRAGGVPIYASHRGSSSSSYSSHK